MKNSLFSVGGKSLKDKLAVKIQLCNFQTLKIFFILCENSLVTHRNLLSFLTNQNGFETVALKTLHHIWNLLGVSYPYKTVNS